MTEEPYRWVEAIQNRREYIETQLASGSPIVALSYAEGILLFTLSRERQKIFEIYDRIAMGGIGHPGDIERLRMAAIELCSTEGFARSAQDVALRRLANYSLSPALKAAFEQVYGAPYLARLLFAELSRGGDGPDLFLRLEYDGAIRTNGGALPFGHPPGSAIEHFGVISGTSASAELMERYLREHHDARGTLHAALARACDAWSLGHLALGEALMDLPAAAVIARHRAEQLAHTAIEAAVLERKSTLPMSWRPLAESELRRQLA